MQNQQAKFSRTKAMTMQEPFKKRLGYKSYNKPTYKTTAYVKPKLHKFPDSKYFKNVN